MVLNKVLGKCAGELVLCCGAGVEVVGVVVDATGGG